MTVHHVPVPPDFDVTMKVKHGTIRGKCKWNHAFNPSERFDKAQKFVDQEVISKSEQYTPQRSGVLHGSATRATTIGSGEVQYNTPYARYQYYGKVMVGPAPKRVTNIPLTYAGAPQRGAKWFERMKTGHKSEILRGAAKILGGN